MQEKFSKLLSLPFQIFFTHADPTQLAMYHEAMLIKIMYLAFQIFSIHANHVMLVLRRKK